MEDKIIIRFDELTSSEIREFMGEARKREIDILKKEKLMDPTHAAFLNEFMIPMAKKIIIPLLISLILKLFEKRKKESRAIIIINNPQNNYNITIHKK